MQTAVRTIDPNDLQSHLRGRLIGPSDRDFDEARTVYNAMIDKRPAFIARCAGVADVIAAVGFARQNGLPLAVRGGGHNGPGLGLVENGVVVDLSAMRSVRVDPRDRTVRVEGGATWSDVDHATHAFGLATPSGIISTTGVGGLTLGGGHGYLSRRYGLTVDNLVEADVVLADGRLVTASERDHADLFWALRGGGGNFGVVTSFVFRLHAVGTVIGGPMMWPAEASRDVLRWYRELIPAAGRDTYGWFGFHMVPPLGAFPQAIHGKSICMVTWCFTGDREEAEAVLGEARQVAEPIFEHVSPVPYPALQGLFDPIYPPGLQWYWKGDFVKDIPDDAVEEHVRFGTALGSPHSTMHLYPVDGAVHDMPDESTSFGFRDATWSSVFAGVDPDPGKREAITGWARRYWEALHPYAAGGAYVNFMMDEGDERIRATYRGNYERLRDVKTQYDPRNLFRSNQNIPPRG